MKTGFGCQRNYGRVNGQQQLLQLQPLHLCSWFLVSWLSFCGVGFNLISTARAFTAANCRKSLGMQSGAIPDDAITASSSYDIISVGPTNARIRTERNGGAWCPKRQISRDVYEWIEIDLQELKVVTQIETQGRFGNGQGQEFAESYMLEYRRSESGLWIRFKDRRQNEIFPGNSNTYMVELREVNPPVIARWVRIVPHSNHPRTVCMRIELYGCPWRDGVVSYSLPQGDSRGVELDLFDFTYDGQNVDGQLTGGLGQLTDGVEGHSNFRLDPDIWGRKGYEWVGWRNDSTPSVCIVFEFDRLRNFTAARIHSNNMFSRDVRVFRQARLQFAVDGSTYDDRSAIVYDHPRDNLIDFARNVIVSVPGGRVARFVRAELFFDARWLLISEVRFESDIVSQNYTELMNASPISTSRIFSRHDDYTESSFVRNISDEFSGDEAVQSRSSTPSPPQPQQPQQPRPAPAPSPRLSVGAQLIGIAVGAVFVLALLALVAVIFCRRRAHLRRSATQKDAGKCAVVMATNARYCLSGSTGHPRLAARRLRTGRFVSNREFEIGSLDSVVKEAVVMATAPRVGGSTRCFYSGGGGLGGVPRRDDSLTVATTTMTSMSCKMANGMSFSNVATTSDVFTADDDYDDYYDDLPATAADNGTQFTPVSSDGVDLLSRELLPKPPPTPVGFSVLSTQSAPFFVAAPQRDLSNGCSALSPKRVLSNGCSALPLTHLLHTSLNETLNGRSTLLDRSTPLVEIPRDNLKFVRKLGQGQFGVVHLCELLHTNDNISGDFAPNQHRSVAVKIFNRVVTSRSARSAFELLLATMSGLKHVNVVSLLGVCSRDEPPCVLMEHAKHGDLFHFLESHRPPDGAVSQLVPLNQSPTRHALSYGCLIYMSTQIASAMKYLETLNVVHGELMARSCLVAVNFLVKLADFGLRRYSCNSNVALTRSSSRGESALPIRWWAWESVLLNEFTTRGDVWSFAVTLWEILTFARRRPFDLLTDDQFVDNCSRVADNDIRQVASLPQPANCPREIYDLMVQCWNRERVQRPTFHEVHMFLQRRNSGYNPDEEYDKLMMFTSATNGDSVV